jgi:hypothetical protein
MNSILWLASQMTETKVVLVSVPAVTITHWILRVCRRRPFDIQELILVSFDVVAVITGVSIFVQAFKMSESSPEHAVWSGIAGVCIAMLFLDQAIQLFRKLLFSPESAPHKPD